MTELEATKAQRDHLNEAVVRLCAAAKLAMEHEQVLRLDLQAARDVLEKDFIALRFELALRTESCEQLLKESRGFEAQRDQALRDLDQRDAMKAPSPDAPSAPTNPIPEPAGAVATSMYDEAVAQREALGAYSAKLAAELRDAKAESARLSVEVMTAGRGLEAEVGRLAREIHEVRASRAEVDAELLTAKTENAGRRATNQMLLSSVAKLENASDVRDSERVMENSKLREALQAAVDALRTIHDCFGLAKEGHAVLVAAAALGVKPVNE